MRTGAAAALSAMLACSADTTISPIADNGSSGSTTVMSTDTGELSTSSGRSPASSSGSEGTSSAGPGVMTSGGSTRGDGDTTGGTTELATTTGGDSDGLSTGTGGDEDGLGMLGGECGLIDALELLSPEPFVFENAIDFDTQGFDYDQLTTGGKQVHDEGNLGGSSLLSEVISYEVLARCEAAALLATEANITYLDPMGTKTDLLVDIDGLTVGVSVTRAFGFPPEDPYTIEQAEVLLDDKLGDVLASSANVAPEDQWVKQILHVLAYEDMHAQSVLEAYQGLPADLTADTIVLVTVTHGNDAFVY